MCGLVFAVSSPAELSTVQPCQHTAGRVWRGAGGSAPFLRLCTPCHSKGDAKGVYAGASLVAAGASKWAELCQSSSLCGAVCAVWLQCSPLQVVAQMGRDGNSLRVGGEGGCPAQRAVSAVCLGSPLADGSSQAGGQQGSVWGVW